MDLQIHSADNTIIMELIGRFDAFEVKQVHDSLDKILNTAQDEVVWVIVDFSKVNFIDSTALATLVKGMKQCRNTGGDLHIACLQKSVKIVFDLTRLDKVFQIFETLDEATAAFK